MESGGKPGKGRVRRLFPRVVATAECAGEAPEAPLHPEEEAALRRAVAKRRREFRAGRACARRALAALGLPPVPLPIGADRAPVWPEGVVGSITHTEGLCAAAVARQSDLAGLGLDAERLGAVGDHLVERICTGAERAWMEHTPPPARGDWPTLVFSAKESLYKAVHGAGGLEGIPGFHAATLSYPPENGFFRAELHPGAWPEWAPPTLAGRFLVAGAHVLTGVWIAAAAPARSS